MKFNPEKRYTDNQIKWLKDYFDAEIKSIRQAVYESKKSYNDDKKETKSNYISDKASSNEFRGQLKDQASTFVTRRELWSAVAMVIAIVLGLMAYLKTEIVQ